MQTQRFRLDRLAADSATAFLLAVLCVYPLYIDKFSNLGVTKFTGVFTLFLGFCLWLAACGAIGAHGVPGRWQKRDGRTLSLAAVALTTALSTVCSLSPAASVWGLGGYYGGLMMVLFTSLGYLCVRAFATAEDFDGIALAVGVTSAIVTVLYVLNVFNIDLIGTYANTAVVERAQFFSTLGQKNFNSGYLAVTLPIVFWMFLSARGSRRTVAFGIPTFMGGLALAVVDADGLLLGLAAAAAVLVCGFAAGASAGGLARWYMSAAMLLGALCWRRAVQPTVHRAAFRLTQLLLAPLRFVHKRAVQPVRTRLTAARNCRRARHIAKKSRKSKKSAEKRLQKPSKVLYN